MSRNHDEYDDIPSLVPERDELVSHRKRRRGTAAGNAPIVQEVVSTSGWVIFFLTLLVLGMGATGAGGWYFYQQGVEMQEQLLSARTRILQLEGTLNLVDESASEQLGDLVERVQLNFSEIDKLWAARNTLRSEMATLTGTANALKESTTALEGTVGNHERLLSDNVATIQARIDEINRNFAGMDNLGQQLTVLNADLNRVKTAMATVEADVENRLSTAEQDIESINVFRLQVNQSLSSLQDSINRLQQRLAAP